MNRRIGIALLMIVLLGGCFGGAARTPFVRQYVLEYPPPRSMGPPVTEAMVQVTRFSVDRLFAGQAMIYRLGPFEREAYTAQRWRVSPAEMVTELLRRDLREATLFRAVLSEREVEEARFLLTGGLEEFSERWEAGRRTALLAATVTLLDRSRKVGSGLVVFQRGFRSEMAISEEGAEGQAAAMSRAMADLSRQVIAEIASAMKARGR